MYEKILITGCAGFIGGHFCEKMLTSGHDVIGVDALTYAGNQRLIESFQSQFSNFQFYEEDIINQTDLYGASKVFNFAAESHVANSIDDASRFITTNVDGVRNILDLIKSSAADTVELVHISTDEVYGDIKYGEFTEESCLNPSNPYAASKAAADLLIKSYERTFGIRAKIVRPTNNYGTRQHPEKLIPLVVNNFFQDSKIPLHDQGEPIRTWLHVADTCSAICHLSKCTENGIYNVNGPEELKNIDTVKALYDICYQFRQLKPLNSYLDLDYGRPGQDIRYSVSDGKLKQQTNWQAKRLFTNSLHDIVRFIFETQ